MKNLMLGMVLGSLLTAGLGIAGDLYGSKGQLAAPKGSVQSYDYFRQRQQFLDIAAMRRQAEQLGAPCRK